VLCSIKNPSNVFSSLFCAYLRKIMQITQVTFFIEKLFGGFILNQLFKVWFALH
jgi:hypothetical protein